jgi:hypothetical protein
VVQDDGRVLIELSDDADPETLEELTLELREEVLGLDVAAVDQPSAGPAPDGSRGVDAAALGTLLVTLTTPEVLPSLLDLLKTWLSGRRGGGVRITLGGDTLELDNASRAERKALVDDWLRRHEPA